MNCRTFRKSHVPFVDCQLSVRQSEAMYAHLDMCERCSRFDTTVRRGLLVARNLRPIEPSPDFAARLEARLQRGPAESFTAFRDRSWSASRLLAIVAVIMAAVVLGRALWLDAAGNTAPRATTVAITHRVPRGEHSATRLPGRTTAENERERESYVIPAALEVPQAQRPLFDDVAPRLLSAGLLAPDPDFSP